MVRMCFRQLHKTAGMSVPTSLKEPTGATRPGSMDVYFLENRARGFHKLQADPVKKEAAAGLLSNQKPPETWKVAQWRSAWEQVKVAEPLPSKQKANIPKTRLPWQVDDAPADPLTLAPQTQSRRRSPRRVCDMFRNMIPLEGDVVNRTF